MIPDNSIICGDCLDIMKQIPDNSIDLVLTDPPYGIGASSVGFLNSTSPIRENYCADWDNKTPDEIYFQEMFRVGKNQVIWGGNYFIEYLKNARCVIIWDKKTGNNSYADGEMAWTSFDDTLKIIPKLWLGANAKEKNEKRYHPTQKSVYVMKWILEKYTNPADLILDPFAGSGTTCVAAKMLGRKYIGIEISPEYCEIAKRRIENTGIQAEMRI